MSRTPSCDVIVLSAAGGTPTIDPWSLTYPDDSRPVDFREFQAYGQLGEAAVRLLRRRTSRISGMAGKSTLRFLFSAMEASCKSAAIDLPKSASELTKSVADDVVDRIRSSCGKSITSRTNKAEECSFYLQRLVGTGFWVRLVVPVPSRSLLPQIIPQQEFDDLLGICWDDVERTRQKYARVHALLDGADQPKTDVAHMSLAELYRHYATTFKCKPWLDGESANGERRFKRRLSHFGLNRREFEATIFPGIEEAIPFILLLIGLCGANLKGVLEIKRDCLNGDTLTVRKDRGKPGLKHIKLPPHTLLQVQRVLSIWNEISRYNRLDETIKDSPYLWIVRKKIQRSGRFVSLVAANDGSPQYFAGLKKWGEKLSLAKETLSSLSKRLRKAAAARVYRENGGDTIPEQVHGTEQALGILTHSGVSPACYGLSLISIGDVVRSIVETEIFTDALLEPYLARATAAFGIN